MNTQEINRFSLKNFFFVLFFKLHVFIGVFLLIVSSTTLYAFFVAPRYRASAYILLKPIIDSRNLPVSGQNFFEVQPLTPIDINTELEIIKSREVVLDVIKRLNIKMQENEAIKYISEGFDASSVTASFAIRISKEGNDPEVITKIVNTYTDAYINRHIDVYRSKNEISFYENKVKEKEDELYYMQNNLVSLIKKYKVVDFDIQKEKYIENISSLKDQIVKLDFDIIKNNIIINFIIKNNFDIDIDEFRGNEYIKNMLLNVYPSLLQEREKIFSLYTENSDERKDFSVKIKNFNESILKEKEKIFNGIKLKIKYLNMQKQTIKNTIKEIEKNIKEASEAEIKYKNILSLINQVRSIYILYLNKLEDERIQEQMDISGASNLSLISKAHIPLKPFFPLKKIMVFSSVIVGLCASVSSAFIAYYLDNTVKREEDIILLTEIQTIVSLQEIKHV